MSVLGQLCDNVQGIKYGLTCLAEFISCRIRLIIVVGLVVFNLIIDEADLLQTQIS